MSVLDCLHTFDTDLVEHCVASFSSNEDVFDPTIVATECLDPSICNFDTSYVVEKCLCSSASCNA